MVAIGEQAEQVAEAQALSHPIAARAVGAPWGALPRRAASRRWREPLGVVGVLVSSCILNIYRLNTEGYGNTYYAAAVKSMLASWHNFFVSFDPGGFGGGFGAMTFSGAGADTLDPKLVQYLEVNQGQTRNLVATPTSSYASLFILATGRPVLALGGYQGWDRVVTPAQLAGMVGNGSVRFFLMPSGGATGNAGPPGTAPGGAMMADANSDLLAWVRTSCAPVSSTLWQSTPLGGGRGGGQQLYDCASSPAS